MKLFLSSDWIIFWGISTTIAFKYFMDVMADVPGIFSLLRTDALEMY